MESAYQRRADLIPNLVATVKGYAAHEKETLEGVIKARSEATKTTIDPSNITPEQLQQFNQAQGGLSSALSRLLVTVERYPELKANQNFLKLQDELTSTENTIQTARTRYNEAIKPYNVHVNTFPNTLLAGVLGFEDLNYYKSDIGSEKAPEIDFEFQ